MLFKTKNYLFALLLTSTLCLHGMELTDEYPFNVKHSKVNTLNQVVRVVGGYYIGKFGGIAIGMLVTAIPMGCYNLIHRKNSYERYYNSSSSYGLDQERFIVGGACLGCLSGIAYGLYSQISYINRRTNLYEFVADQNFLDIIKANNQMHARAWLASCYKDHATIKDNTGKTALMHAAIHGAHGVAKELLSAGAIADEQDNQGRTALDYAKEHNHTLMIELLVESIA